jgi:hypothetical protein
MQGWKQSEVRQQNPAVDHGCPPDPAPDFWVIDLSALIWIKSSSAQYLLWVNGHSSPVRPVRFTLPKADIAPMKSPR